MIRIFSLLAFLVLLISARPATAGLSNQPVPRDQLPRGIVIVQGVQSEGTRFTGSGVLIGNQILTAAHVLEPASRITRISANGIGDIPLEGITAIVHEKARPIGSKSGPMNDLALIELRREYETDFRWPSREEAWEFAADDDLYWFGYGLYNNSGNVNILMGSPVGRITGERELTHVVTDDRSKCVGPGDSGGPLAKRVGPGSYVVIGVVSYGVGTTKSYFEKLLPNFDWLTSHNALQVQREEPGSNLEVKSKRPFTSWCRDLLADLF